MPTDSDSLEPRSDAATPRTDSGKVIQHLLCVHCGYDLFGHDAAGRCAECRRAVRLTLNFDKRRPSDAWLPFTLAVLTPVLLLWSLVSPKRGDLSTGDHILRMLSYSGIAIPCLLLLMMIYAIIRAERTAMIAWHATAFAIMIGMILSITVAPLLMR